MKSLSVFLSAQTKVCKQALVCVLAFVLILFALPGAAFAEPIGPGDEICTMCHWSEVSQWQNSHHAMEGVACETCHGDLTTGHPDDNSMPVPVGSDVCEDCHEETVSQWHQSLHAAEGVDCVDCHVPHSQTTRLNSEELCVTCHDDDVGVSWELTGHEAAGVSCVDCHVSSPVMAAGQGATPDHAFTSVPSHLCSNCHAANLHEPATQIAGDTTSSMILASYTERTNMLTEQLKQAEDQNKSLQTWTLIALGLGLGIGLFLGLIMMVVMGFIINRSEKTA